MKPRPDRQGYLKVSLSCDDQQVDKHVHILLLESHCGPCPPGMEACHGPLGNQDNRWPESGLHWGSPAENAQDRLRDGTQVRGEQQGAHKLTEAQVQEIHARLAAGEISTRERPSGKPQRAVAAEYGVSQSTISDIIRGRTWAWL